MGSKDDSIPEEYVDILVQEFAYDPIRLCATEDPAQVLYNRRTLETIWDTKYEAVNPFTRQPFDINNSIPQAELRKQMREYVLRNPSLQVIPDYSKVLRETEMKNLLNELISEYEHLINATKSKKRKRQPEEDIWKPVWQRFNLLRLYCQHSAENRELFCSIKGYEFLYGVITEKLLQLCCRYHSCDDAKEVGKEVARIVDVIGLEESDLRTAPESFLWTLVHILCYLGDNCNYIKIHSTILRIFCRIFHDSNIDCKKVLCSCVVQMALYVLERCDNSEGISNEDLYNGISVLKSAWLKNSVSFHLHNSSKLPDDLIDIIVKVAQISISRLKDLNVATNNHREDDEKAKNINLVSIALERVLCLINLTVTVTPYDSGRRDLFCWCKRKLEISGIREVIVGLVELVLAGYRCLQGSSQLQFAINIAATLQRDKGIVRVFTRFRRSGILDDDQYCSIKPSLQRFYVLLMWERQFH